MTAMRHDYGTESDCTCGRNFSTVRGLREHLTKARAGQCDGFQWDSWSDVIIREQACVKCGKRQRDHAA